MPCPMAQTKRELMHFLWCSFFNCHDGSLSIMLCPPLPPLATPSQHQGFPSPPKITQTDTCSRALYSSTEPSLHGMARTSRNKVKPGLAHMRIIHTTSLYGLLEEPFSPACMSLHEHEAKPPQLAAPPPAMHSVLHHISA